MAVIALDVGGTKIKGALVDKNLQVIKSLRIPTESDKGKARVVKNIDLVISALLSKKRSITAIGVSFPGFADAKGKLLFAGNALSFFVGYNLQSHLEKKFNLPVLIENDANCFTLAESYLGSAQKFKVVLGVVWGSGVGSGLVVKEQASVHQIFKGEKSHSFLFRGSHDGAMELGHTPLILDKGFTTLEKLVGGAFLTKKYKVENVTRLFKDKPKVEKEVLERFSQGLAIAINLTNPDAVVIGGGVSNIPASKFKKILSLVKKYALPTHTKDLKIIKYGLAEDAGLQGIALIALGKKLS